MIKIRIEPIKTNIKIKLDDKIVVYRAGEPQIKEVEYVENGEYSVEPDVNYDLEEVKIKVNVPIPEGYLKPEGTLNITENGAYDVTEKASVNVNIENSGSGNDELVKQLIDGTITEIVIPEGTTKIYHYGFYGFANLTKVIIPNSVKTIGREAFYYCTNLTNLIIPASVTDISVYALRCGSSSNKVTFRFEGTTPPKIQSGTFSALGDIEKIEVPMLAVDTYKTTTNWTKYAEKIVGY